MTREEMIEFIIENPDVKIRHDLFIKDEYIYSRLDGKIYSEDGYLFEDWTTKEHAGIRIRKGTDWENGWSLFEEEDFMLCPFLTKQITLHNTINDSRVLGFGITEIRDNDLIFSDFLPCKKERCMMYNVKTKECKRRN